MEIVRFISIGVTIALAFFAVSIMSIFITNAQTRAALAGVNNGHHVMKLPALYRWLGIVGDLVWILLIIFSIEFGGATLDFWSGLGFAGFLSLGALLAIAQILWRIDLYDKEEYFLLTTAFGRKHTIFYREISFCKRHNNYTIIIVNKKRFYIDDNASNIEAMWRLFQKNKIRSK